MTPDDHRSGHGAAHDPRNDDILIWVNGDLLPRADAKVSVYDSGCMMGDGVSEGLRLYSGNWVLLDLHVSRLLEGAEAIDLDIGMTPDQIVAALEKTRAANGMTTDAHARLMITRGPKVRPFQDPCLSRSGPTVVIIMEHSAPVDRSRRGIPCREKTFSLVETYSAAEAFLTGTFGAQTPVAEIDGRAIGDGSMGPVTRRIRDLYKARVGA